MELLAGPVGPLVIFVMRVCDVSLGTVRLVLVTRGMRVPAAVVGFFEVLIWITASGTAILNITSPLHVLGYAGGFGTGTWVGMWIESKIPMGTATVQAYCRAENPSLSGALREAGLRVTEMKGQGLEGPVDIVSMVVPRRLVPIAVRTIESNDPDAFIAVYDARIYPRRVGALRRK
ncbi:MAG: DUF5698 domain-containing protein [Gemmatimonadota bacterium]|jgi:uncharacterized protein YebE (UPF0316 family)